MGSIKRKCGIRVIWGFCKNRIWIGIGNGVYQTQMRDSGHLGILQKPDLDRDREWGLSNANAGFGSFGDSAKTGFGSGSGMGSIKRKCGIRVIWGFCKNRIWIG